MNKSKKLLSLICALSMVFSVFAGFTVARAEDPTAGIKLVYDKKASTGTKKVVKAQYVGLADGIQGSTVELAIPADLAENIKSINGVTTLAGFSSQSTVDDVKKDNVYTFTAAGGAVTPLADNTIVTITIELNKGNAEDIVLDFVKGENAQTAVDGGTNLWLNEGAITVESTVLERDPSIPAPPPTTKPRPTQMPVESASPVETFKPVEVTTGIKLVYDEKASTATKKVVKAQYVGLADGIQGSTVELAIPAGLAENIKSINGVTTLAGFSSQSTVDDVKKDNVYTFTAAGGAVTPLADNTIVTITIELNNANTEDVILDFVKGEAAQTAVDGGTNLWLNEGAIQAAGVAIPVFGAKPDKTPTPKEVKLKDYVGKGGAEAAKAAQDAGKTVYLTVDVKKKDGSAAKYGVDYTAEYPKGTPLSEKEYSDLIYGYTADTDMSDVINNMVFKLLSNDVSSISTSLNALGEANQLVDPVVDQPIDGKTDTAKKASITVTPSRTRAVAGDGKKVTVTTKIANPSEDGVLTVKTTSDSLDCVSGSGIKVIKKDAAEDAPIVTLSTAAVTIDPTDTIEFMPAVKGTVVLSYEYKYTNNLGDADTAKNETKITISAPAVDDNDDDDDNSSTGGSYGGGSIAHGPGSQVNAGKIAFTDLDTVPWAEDAILALVDKKVINGRSNTIFDPNGTVTRAEFAKMVVLGFDLTGGTASNFSDVAATDWYAPYVATGYNNGVISGYDDGTFRPNGLISRQEMAAMISRAIAAANKTAPAIVEAASFSDSWQIGSWAIDSVTSLQRAGIINGMTDTTFEPLANATRAQAAVIINRAMTNAR